MGLPETTTTSSPSFLKALITIDASVLLFLHTIFKPILPIFLLLLEYSADFWFSFHVSLSLFLVSSFFSFLSILFILGHLRDLDLIGLIKLTFRRIRPHYNPNTSPAIHADNFSFPVAMLQGSEDVWKDTSTSVVKGFNNMYISLVA
ncbi:hypothetical protein GOBAR_DD23396 [Gossypium barbadense]|nr:hypothetical protein GOBAR_DD23396 [Gossypium barbadense]